MYSKMLTRNFLPAGGGAVAVDWLVDPPMSFENLVNYAPVFVKVQRFNVHYNFLPLLVNFILLVGKMPELHIV